jgi:hypothetical protein
MSKFVYSNYFYQKADDFIMIDFTKTEEKEIKKIADICGLSIKELIMISVRYFYVVKIKNCPKSTGQKQ